MVDIRISGLWRGRPVLEHASVDLKRNLDEQQKQVAKLAVETITAGAPDWNTEESAVDFALRLGFTKLDYQYRDGGSPVVVDVLDPSKAI
jgi:hypothetical protein